MPRTLAAATVTAMLPPDLAQRVPKLFQDLKQPRPGSAPARPAVPKPSSAPGEAGAEGRRRRQTAPERAFYALGAIDPRTTRTPPSDRRADEGAPGRCRLQDRESGILMSKELACRDARTTSLRVVSEGDLNPHPLARTSPSSYSHRDTNPLPCLVPGI
jgi:hypothetical protein